jgi:hypothetical protein
MAAPKGNKNGQRGLEKRQRVVMLLPAELVRDINYAADTARVTRTAVVESVLLVAFPPADKINN